MKEVKLGMVLIALLIGLFTVYQPIADLARSIPYKFSKQQGEVLHIVSPDVQKRFDSAVPQGAYGNADGPVVFYSSFYDEQTHAYFYRIINNSDQKFYARSRIFLVFLGRAGVEVPSKKEFCVKVWDQNPPVERKETFYLSDSRYSLNLSRGFDMELVMPREPQHRLVWRPY